MCAEVQDADRIRHLIGTYPAERLQRLTGMYSAEQLEQLRNGGLRQKLDAVTQACGDRVQQGIHSKNADRLKCIELDRSVSDVSTSGSIDSAPPVAPRGPRDRTNTFEAINNFCKATCSSRLSGSVSDWSPTSSLDSLVGRDMDSIQGVTLFDIAGRSRMAADPFKRPDGVPALQLHKLQTSPSALGGFERASLQAEQLKLQTEQASGCRPQAPCWVDLKDIT